MLSTSEFIRQACLGGDACEFDMTRLLSHDRSPTLCCDVGALAERQTRARLAVRYSALREVLDTKAMAPCMLKYFGVFEGMLSVCHDKFPEPRYFTVP